MKEQEMALENIIYKIRIGSNLYGTYIKDSSDEDFSGVFVPEKDYVLGIKMVEQVSLSQKSSKTIRNQVGDVDYVLYALPKLIQLLIGNNPNIIEFLYVPKSCVVYSSEWSNRLIENRHLFLSKKAYHTFTGYAYSQRRKLEVKRENMTGRKELVDKFGFDCYHENTEFLTENGWKKYKEIEDTEKLGTINPKTFRIVFQRFFERIEKPFNGKLYYYKGNYTSFCVTQNHRMFVSKRKNRNWNIVPLLNIFNSKKSRFVTLNGGKNYNKDYKIDDDILSLIGLYVSEGTVNFRNKKLKSLCISQTIKGKKEVFDIMRRISNKFNLKEYTYTHNKKIETKWITHNKNLINFIYNLCGHLSSKKRLPKFINKLSKKQAEILLHSLILGDGTEKKNKYVYYTINSFLADDIQKLAMLAEKDTNKCGGYTRISNFNNKTSTMYQVTISKEYSIPKNVMFNYKIKKHKRRVGGAYDTKGGKLINYKGKIVCFSVPNELLITRFNGKIAVQGNTKFASHIIRLLLELLQILTEKTLTFPIPQNNMVRDIKLGVYDLQWIFDKADYLGKLCDEAYIKSDLQYSANEEEINKLQIKLLEDYWIGN